MTKNTCWVVFCGRIPGVYYDWTFGAAKQVNKFPGAIHQGYQNEEKAKMAYEYYIGGKGVMKQRDLDKISNSESVHQGLGYTVNSAQDHQTASKHGTHDSEENQTIRLFDPMKNDDDLDCKTEENQLKQLKREYDRDSETLGIKKNGYEHLRQNKNVTQGMKVRMDTKRKKFIEDEDIITEVSENETNWVQPCTEDRLTNFLVIEEECSAQLPSVD
jgi:hypothetical protein